MNQSIGCVILARGGGRAGATPPRSRRRKTIHHANTRERVSVAGVMSVLVKVVSSVSFYEITKREIKSPRPS